MISYSSKAELQNAIKVQITSNDAQAVKAMLRIYEYQTADEKRNGTVRYFNGVGFTGTDGFILSSFCEQYRTRGFLSAKQLVIVRKKIGKYSGQLLAQAIEKGIYVKSNGVWVIAA